MSTGENIGVFTEWQSNGTFFIWAEQDGPRCSSCGEIVKELIFRLFARHRPSFYGTLINTGEVGGRPGILLSPRTALEFFSEPTYIETLDWQWSEEILRLRKVAPGIRETLAQGRWGPDFKKWQENKTGWKLDCPEQLAGETPPYFEAWVDGIIEELIKESPEISQVWDKLLKSYPLLKPAPSQAGCISDEEDWLEAIGWKLDAAPFRTCLQLAEPAGEDDSWELNILLQDKEEPSRVVEWKPADLRSDESLPTDWLAHRGKIERDIMKWIKVVPWLQDDDHCLEKQVTLRRKLSEDETWEFLSSASLQLINSGLTVYLPKWWEEVQKLKPVLKIRTRSSVGSWGEKQLGVTQIVQFDWKLAVGELELTEEEFRRLAGEKRRLMQFRGKWVQLEPAFIQKVQRLVRQKKKGLALGDVLNMHFLNEKSFTGEGPDAGVSEEDPVKMELELNGQLSRMVEQLSDLPTVTVEDTFPSFQGRLRNYQRVGSSWLLLLRNFGLGGCLADDMGLGKTIQWIAYLLKAREGEKPQAPALLICPTSVLGNWQKELARFAPGFKVYLHYGPQRKKGEEFLFILGEIDVVITSYNLAHMDEDDLCAVEWDCICLDEAQNIKNAYTKQASAVRRLKGRHRVALTGTPMENRLTELWSIMDFLNPGYLGGIREFKRRFVNVIERKREARDIERVQHLIRPFLLRRIKSDPAVELDLPEKQELKEYISLTAEQASLYENILRNLFERLETSTGMARRGLILSTLTRLKQLCDHPALLLKEENSANLTGRSNKIDRLLEMIRALRQEGERCLIFTQFVRMGYLLRNILEQELKENILFLHGGTPKSRRDKMIARFQEPGLSGREAANIFILSLKAGGLGLNLTAANHVFHFDRWWNPAVENQATDRSHRIGQKHHVLVHKFICLGTLEERIDDMIERKQGLNEQIVGGGEAWITELSTGELREIFTLRKEWIGGNEHVDEKRAEKKKETVKGKKK